MESQTRMCSFLSRLALPGLMSLILLAPAIARADLMTTFDVSGTARNVSGGKLGSCAINALCPFSGTFTVDTTTGTVESSGFDITFPGLPDFDVLLPADSGPYGGGFEIGAVNSALDGLALQFSAEPNEDSLVDFTGGSITGGGDSSNSYYIAGGSIAPVPEPTSLVLLAGVIGWVVFGQTGRLRKKMAIH